MNYSSLKQTATSLIKSAGLPISLSRDGSQIASGYGVVTPSESKVEEGLMPGSVMRVSKLVMYATASSSAFAPQVGDTVTSSQGSWRIENFQAYKPSTTTIAYKLEIA